MGEECSVQNPKLRTISTKVIFLKMFWSSHLRRAVYLLRLVSTNSRIHEPVRNNVTDVSDSINRTSTNTTIEVQSRIKTVGNNNQCTTSEAFVDQLLDRKALTRSVIEKPQPRLASGQTRGPASFGPSCHEIFLRVMWAHNVG